MLLQGNFHTIQYLTTVKQVRNIGGKAIFLKLPVLKWIESREKYKKTSFIEKVALVYREVVHIDPTLFILYRPHEE